MDEEKLKLNSMERWYEDIRFVFVASCERN